LVLFPTLLIYYVVADSSDVGERGFRTFQVVFYAILIFAPVAALVVDWVLADRFSLMGRWLASGMVSALVVMAFVLLPVLQVASAWNECVFGEPFPFEVAGCD
jgi:hypothetical protein